MKKIISILFIISVILITGCQNRAEDVKLKSKNDIIKYAKNNYGKVEFVSENKEDNSITYTLKDSQYKFIYTCISKASNFGIDGSSFGYYESTNCDFDEKYVSYIKTKLYEQNIIPLSCKNNNCLFSSMTYNEAQNSSKIIKKIDTRKYYKNYYLETIDNEFNKGKYYIYTDEYIQE